MTAQHVARDPDWWWKLGLEDRGADAPVRGYVSEQYARDVVDSLRGSTFEYMTAALLANQDFLASMAQASYLCFRVISKCDGCGRRVVPGGKDGMTVLGSHACPLTRHAFFRSRFGSMDHFCQSEDVGLARCDMFDPKRPPVEYAHLGYTFVPACLLQFWKRTGVQVNRTLGDSLDNFEEELRVANETEARGGDGDPAARPDGDELRKKRRKCISELRCSMVSEASAKDRASGETARFPASLATALARDGSAVCYAAKIFLSKYPNIPTAAYALYAAVPQARARPNYAPMPTDGVHPVVSRELTNVYL